MPFQSYLSHLICFISIYHQAVINRFRKLSDITDYFRLKNEKKTIVTILTCFMLKYLTISNVDK